MVEMKDYLADMMVEYLEFDEVSMTDLSMVFGKAEYLDSNMVRKWGA